MASSLEKWNIPFANAKRDCHGITALENDESIYKEPTVLHSQVCAMWSKKEPQNTK